jgi:hypothetical protein
VEINSTRIIPSPRLSSRVPFGTGASISRWVNGDRAALHTYPQEPFDDLKQLFTLVPQLFKAVPADVAKLCSRLPVPLQDFLLRNSGLTNIAQAGDNSASRETFAKRFFAWFDGLKTVQYLNDSCRQTYGKQPVETAASRFLYGTKRTNGLAVGELLKIYRKIDRNG